MEYSAVSTSTCPWQWRSTHQNPSKCPYFYARSQKPQCHWQCASSHAEPTSLMRMGVKMNIALRKRTLSPIRLVLEDWRIELV